jgi:hypothetical protein
MKQNRDVPHGGDYPVQRETELLACSCFDRGMRNSADGTGWNSRASPKCKVETDRRLHPIEEIIRLGTGARALPGGDQPNDYLMRHGFTIVTPGVDDRPNPEQSIGNRIGSNGPRRFWWVNQGSTYKAEAAEGYLWAPAKTKSGMVAQHHANLKRVQKGDTIFHYANGCIKAVSIATGAAESKARPEGLPSGSWGLEGYLVPTTYHELGTPIRLSEIPQAWRTKDAGPFNRQGGVIQGYLFPLVETVVRLMSDKFRERLPALEGLSTESTLTLGEMGGRYDPRFDRVKAVQALVDVVGRQGYVFEPWQIAAYVTAVRTKPFVLLAGISGTGKSKLPKLVAEATGGTARLVPVRPDWTDSAEVLGYVDLQDDFRPGSVLEFMQTATENPDQHFVCILDEMNLARVEQYFAEVLSKIEDREPNGLGGFRSSALISQKLPANAAAWASIGLPPNLALVGTVNMDESTHGFSRKVLDRAFTIELSDIDLTAWDDNPPTAPMVRTVPWPASAWNPRAISLASLRDLDDASRETIRLVISVLTKVNSFLTQAQVQVGYRTRDEVALFVLHASEIADVFVTRSKHKVNPLDLALNMKVLPRLAGGSAALKRALLQLLGWSYNDHPIDDDSDARVLLEAWGSAGRPAALFDAIYPYTAARLCLMWERFLAEGFTSFWL